MDVVDEGFDGVLIFRGVRCKPFCEDGVFELGDVALEDWFLCGVVAPILVYSSALSSDISFLLLPWFYPHGDVLVMTIFCTNFETTEMM